MRAVISATQEFLTPAKALLVAFEKESKKSGRRAVVLYAPLFNRKTLKLYRKSG